MGKTIRRVKPNSKGVYRINYKNRIYLGTISSQEEDVIELTIKNSSGEEQNIFASEATFFNHFKKQ